MEVKAEVEREVGKVSELRVATRVGGELVVKKGVVEMVMVEMEAERVAVGKVEKKVVMGKEGRRRGVAVREEEMVVGARVVRAVEMVEEGRGGAVEKAVVASGVASALGRCLLPPWAWGGLV
ncbi:MAG: hypothetical protein SGPRY_006505, partial [Prymnesium sp.]